MNVSKDGINVYAGSWSENETRYNYKPLIASVTGSQK